MFDRYLFKIKSIKAEGSKYVGTGSHSISSSKQAAGDEQAVSLFLAMNPQKEDTVTVKYADEESLLVGILSLETGELTGKLYQGKKLSDRIPAKHDGEFSLRESVPLSFGGPWAGTLVYVQGGEKTVFDPYTVNIANLAGVAGHASCSCPDAAAATLSC